MTTGCCTGSDSRVGRRRAIHEDMRTDQHAPGCYLQYKEIAGSGAFKTVYLSISSHQLFGRSNSVANDFNFFWKFGLKETVGDESKGFVKFVKYIRQRKDQEKQEVEVQLGSSNQS